MGNGPIVADESMAGREMVEDFIVVTIEDKVGPSHFLAEGDGGSRSFRRGNDRHVGVIHQRSCERDVVGEGPLGGISKVGSGNDGDAELFSAWWAFGMDEVCFVEGHRAELLHEEEVVSDAVFDGADGANDFHRMSEVWKEVFFRRAHSDRNQGLRKSRGGRVFFPGDGLGEFDLEVLDHLSHPPGRGVGIVRDDFGDFGDLSPQRGDVFRGKDDDGPVRIGIVDRPDGGNAEARFVDGIGGRNGDGSSVNLGERLI